MKKWCWDKWRVVPRAMWPEINWGGRHIESASNIVFSNGKLDPWSGGGILEVFLLKALPCTCLCLWYGAPPIQCRTH